MGLSFTALKRRATVWRLAAAGAATFCVAAGVAPTVAAAASPEQSPASVSHSLSSASAALWSWPMFRNGIGLSNLLVEENGPDGAEIYTGGSPATFGENAFWHASAYDADRNSYEPQFVSPAIEGNIKRMLTGNVTGDGRKEIVVAAGNDQVHLYDQATKLYLGSFTTTVGGIYGLAVADLDSSGTEEIILTSEGRLLVYSDGALQWSLDGPGKRLAAAQMDDDEGLEIATSTGHVVDVASRTVQWSRGEEYDPRLDAADIDGDGRAELVVTARGNDVEAYDVESQSLKWTIPSVMTGIGVLRLKDVDGDGIVEILLGGWQQGRVYGYDSATLARKWEFEVPESGVTDIAVADVDGDGTREVLWGAGFHSTGQDLLYIGDWRTETIEWSSVALDGPFVGPEIGDLDGDGEEELVTASVWSRSYYSAGRILVFDNLTLRLRAMSPPIANDRSSDALHGLRLRDVDGDGNQEILVGAAASLAGGLAEIYDFAADNTFSLKWTNATHPEGSPFTSVDAADIDGDGSLEVVCGAATGTSASNGARVYAYDYATRAEKWQSNNLDPIGFWNTVSGLEIANVDGDAALEILARLRNGNVNIFDGATKAQEPPIAGGFSSMNVDGSAIVLGDLAGGVGLYRHNGTAYAQTSHTIVSAAPIDGVTADGLDPATFRVGTGGRLVTLSSGVVQSRSPDYGAPFGARWRQGVTAGLYSINAFRMAAPEMKPEPPITPGTANTAAWMRSQQAEEYLIEAAVDGNFDRRIRSSGWITTRTATFSRLRPGLIYGYRVKARRTTEPVGESAWSRPVFSMQDPNAVAEPETRIAANQRLRIDGPEGGWAIHYNYAAEQLRTSDFIAAPGIFQYALPLEQWIGVYFYDAAAGRFTEAVYRKRTAL